MANWGALIEFFISLLQIVFNAQFCCVVIDGCMQFWHQVVGVATGLPCGTQTANIFLSAFDDSIAASFRPSIDLYMRYIDDVLIIARDAYLSSLLQIFNGFDERIRVTHDVF